MSTVNPDVLIIGGGPAGLSAANSLYQAGITNLLLLERDTCLGGILNQCIHNGFGLRRFKEELTGPEYAQREIDSIHRLQIPYQLNTTVLSINKHREVVAISQAQGIVTYHPKTILLAMGCRERPRGALAIPGDRPAGIYNAGTAQKWVNIDGHLPGKEVVILGSGDIGLIMARRMTLEGAHVKGVIELMPYSSGLKRNIVQCLDDYGIPLRLAHTISAIHGKKRIEAVTVCPVDADRKPILEKAEILRCDTLLLSVGLIPENELTLGCVETLNPATHGPMVNSGYQTECEGVFACGNVLHVHDLVDNVSAEAVKTAAAIKTYLQGSKLGQNDVPIHPEDGIRYTIPNALNLKATAPTTVLFRVDKEYRNPFISVYAGEQRIMHQKRKICTPGEMEQLILPSSLIQENAFIPAIRICVEED